MSKRQFSILTVDDNPTSLKVLYEILKPVYRVFTAQSGERALQFLQKNVPDLIMLDVEMPGMSGYEVMERILKDRRLSDIPVIFLTGRDDSVSERQAFELGAVDYIHKPYSPSVVLARLSLHLELANYRANLQVMVDEKTHQLSKLQDIMLDMLAEVTLFRDEATGFHITRTTGFVKILIDGIDMIRAPGYALSKQYQLDIVRTTRLHDIGKVAVPDNILLKPTRLNDREFNIIKLHTVQGSHMLDEAIEKIGEYSFFNIAREIILSHHEKWDGSGYPIGLAGINIPVSGRIMAIADVYDALISSRPYKEALTHEAAVGIITNDAGTHFDPVLVDLFVEKAQEFHDLAAMYQDD